MWALLNAREGKSPGRSEEEGRRWVFARAENEALRRLAGVALVELASRRRLGRPKSSRNDVGLEVVLALHGLPARRRISEIWPMW